MAGRTQDGTQDRTVSREAFIKNPAAALRRAEASGAVVVTNKNGTVHSVISLPNDARRIVVK